MSGFDWTGGLPIVEQDVRDYLNLEGTTGRYSDAILNSNIRAAASFLQRQTSRQFMPETVQKIFTTNGESYLAVPDFRSISAITLQGAALVDGTSYWKIPDATNSGVYVGIQFRAFGGNGDSYLGNPQWFDRNLDQPRYRGLTSLPNDLAVDAAWGWNPFPQEFLQATKILAAFYTKRPASVLADVQVTPEGTVLSYAQLPVEVRGFIESWKAGRQAVVVI